MKDKILKKIKNGRGETLIETLVALLIVVLPFVFLSTTVVTAARINHKIREDNSSFVTYQSAATMSDKGYSAAKKDGKLIFKGSKAGEPEVQTDIVINEVYKKADEKNRRLYFYYERKR